MAEAVRVFLAGPLRLVVGDVAVDEALLGGRQARLAATFLLAERSRPVSRAELAELLWPGELPRSWEPALRNVLARVRSFLADAGLPPDVLRTMHGSYRLALPAATVVDVEAVSVALERAERCLAAGDPEDAALAALEAREVSARPFLQGEAGLWVEAKQAELRRSYRRSLLVLGQARLAQGDAGTAARDAEELIAAEPLLESAHQLLMRSHAAAGNRGEALRAYERCRRTLVDELGVGPSPETEWLYLALLADEPPRGLGSPAPDTWRAAEVQRRHEHGDGSRFVGRAEELGRLLGAWEAACAGRRRVVLIEGEAGIGKTRLAAEALLATGGDPGLVLQGRCDDEMPIPYQPFTEALDRYVVAADLDDLRRHLAWGGEELSQLVVSLMQRMPELADRSGHVEGERSLLFEAVATFLRSLATSTTVVLVIDDLHWANRASLLLLRHLVRSLADTSLLIIATLRDDEPSDRALAETLARLRREPGVERISLRGLDEEAIAVLVRDEMASETPEQELTLAARLRDETGGNPLFVDERLRQLAELGAHGDLAVEVPEGVKEIVADRFRRLSGGTQQVLRAAAVLGQELDVGALQQLLAWDDDDQLVEALDEATAARFLTEVPGTVGHCRFPHALLRAAVYEGMGSLRRARLHAAAAEVLERHEPRSASDLARHLVLAGLPREAVDHALQAARQALEAFDDEGAAELVEMALAHMGADDGRRLQALLDLGTALRRANRQERAASVFLEAAALARRTSAPQGLAEAALGLFGGATHGGMTGASADERLTLLEEALGVVPPGSELRVRILSALAYAHYFDPDERSEFARQAVAEARRLARPRALVVALSAAWAARWGPHDTEARLALADEMLTIAAAAGDEERELFARLARLGDLVELGDRARVEAELVHVRALLARVPRPWFRWRTRAWEALVRLAAGELDAAEAMAAEALALRADPSDSNAVQCYGIQLACLRLVQGRPHEVIDLVRAGADAYPMVPGYRCVLALLLVEAGDLDGARVEFERFAVDDFTAIPPDANWTTSIGALAEVCAALGDAPRAASLHERLSPVAHRMVVLDAFGGGGVFWGSIAHLVGLLEDAMGRPEEAERHLLEAIEVNRRFGAEPWVARSQRALAAVRRAATSA